MVSVNRDANVVGFRKPLLLRQLLDIGQKPLSRGFNKLGTLGASLEQAGAFELNDHIVVAAVALLPFSIEIETSRLFQSSDPAQSDFLLPLLGLAALTLDYLEGL
ncbi:MAG TPA: hypothetical protein ACQGQH_09490 [Xylella sp.]